MALNSKKLQSKSHDHDHDGPPAGSVMQLSHRIVYLSGAVSEDSISQVIATLVELANQDPTAPITLIVSTYGGSVDEMLSLYDVIKYLPCDVHTVGLGKVMSAGVLIVASGKKGTRSVGQNTRVMMHPISSGAQGTVFQIEAETKELVRMQLQLEKLLAQETGQTQSAVHAAMRKGHDHYFDANECIKFGIADTLISTKDGR
jgi:ATP-dependent Clp protease protease subunit